MAIFSEIEDIFSIISKLKLKKRATTDIDTNNNNVSR